VAFSTLYMSQLTEVMIGDLKKEMEDVDFIERKGLIDYDHISPIDSKPVEN
jgi:hypothetical protein